MEKGFNHEKDEQALLAEGIHLTLGPNGEVLVIKKRVARGNAITLYKWTGTQPRLEAPEVVN